MNRANSLFKKVKVPKVTEEVVIAWNILSKFLNKHPEISFHISPWTKNHDENCYTLLTFNGSEEETILTASTHWESKNKQSRGD